MPQSCPKNHALLFLKSSANLLQFVDALAILLSQAYQLARIRLASVASPTLRLLTQRDHALNDARLLRRELATLRAQRQSLPPHRRPDYKAEQRLAILQLRRLRGWTIKKTARRFVVHPNTIRSWIKAIEGRGNQSLLTDAIRWNRLADAVRWTAHELRRLCPEPEFGTRTIARQLVRAGLAVSRSTVQRVLRESPPRSPPRRRRLPMAAAAGVQPDRLLLPKHPNHVWHMDLTSLRILWFRFTVAAILDGFSRKLVCFYVYARTPNQQKLIRLMRKTTKEQGKPKFLITDHGTQFRSWFHDAMKRIGISHVKARVRAPYLNGKIERTFRTFRIWWRIILCGLSRPHIQRRLDDYQHWYNHYRPHSAIKGLTPDEAWEGIELPQPIPLRQRDAIKPRIDIRRVNCRGDPHLPVINITVQRAA